MKNISKVSGIGFKLLFSALLDTTAKGYNICGNEHIEGGI